MDIAQLIFIFTISAFLGLELIAKIPSQLQTPLMSGSNAISGITIVGAMLATTASGVDPTIVRVLGFVAVILATINVVGGYVVTDRMLAMFKKKEGK
jgi:NAD(P) transhydrogenase subunit alpha